MSMAVKRAGRAYGGMAATGTGRADPAAARIEAHVHLVRRLAWHLRASSGPDLEVEDLVQIGMVALIECARSHENDGQDEQSFAAYAKMRIRGAMIDEMRRRAAMTRGALRRRRDLLTARETLSRRYGRDPDAAELADYMHLEIGEFHALSDEVAGLGYASLDAAYDDHSAWFASDEESPLEAAEKADLRTRLAGEIATLPEREAMVLQLYFVEELNLAEIGVILGVTEARISQLKTAALKTLRGRMSSEE